MIKETLSFWRRHCEIGVKLEKDYEHFHADRICVLGVVTRCF